MTAKRLVYFLVGGAIAAIIFSTIIYKNIRYTNEGTVKVATKFGSIQRVYKPSDGWFTTISPGWEAYEVNLKSFTETTTPRVTSKDNAALQVPISITAATSQENPDIIEYVRKFGFNEEDRHKRRNEILHGLVQTEARNAF